MDCIWNHVEDYSLFFNFFSRKSVNTRRYLNNIPRVVSTRYPLRLQGGAMNAGRFCITGRGAVPWGPVASNKKVAKTVTCAGSSSDQDATPLSYFKYDVFLSFRGSTRPTITDVLYHYLIDERIETFIDNRHLRPSEELEGSLLEAIERSRMSILILCDGYPSSHWCLDELVKIMECSENGRKRPVLPVYFYVSRSDVQYQNNEFAASLARLVKTGRYTHKLKAYKLALCEVGKIYGQRFGEKTRWGAAIDNILEEVRRKLPPLPLYIGRPLGLDSELEKAKSLLEIDSHASCFILGIHGDDDLIRKFVAELYNMIRPHFVAASFLSNVSEKTNESGRGLETLQETILSEMGVEVKAMTGSTFKRSTEIKRRLGHKKVLLVLDDVDSIEQLNSLAGGTDWFGLGSRIIITTRYEHVLDEHVSNNGVVVKKYYISEGSSSTVKEENVVGFEKEFDMVMSQLNEENFPGNVVSIVGMGGLGKTTLAQKVYNSIEARQLFPYRAWVTISQKPVLIQVLRNLLNSLKVPKSEYENSSDEEELKEMVRKCLNGKKYLVVLDDVWDTNNPWGALRGCFPRNNNGSMILVTTRDDRVANTLESKDPHITVSLMNEEESWKLFHTEVFYSTICPPELEAIGRSIAESCNGLPLVIKTTAGIVAKRKKLKEEWEKCKNELPCWSIPEVKDGRKKMVEVLKPSYDDLYEEMKPCFLYLGAFPEDEEILVRDLICMWIAEDFIEKPKIHTGGKSKEEAPPPMEPEDIGERYLDELVERNLVQVESRRRDGKGVKTVKIHDLFRELCISESNNPDNKSNKACRLVFPEDIGSYACLVTPRDKSSTYSLFVHGDVKGWSDVIPEDCKVINVLYLGEFRDGGLVNDDDLKKFESIRFLKGQCVGLYGLFKLQGLQTLHVMSVFLKKISKISIHGGLKQLRHIVCNSRMHLLVDDAEGVKDKMKNLQTLLYVYADSQMGLLLDNDCFTNLRTMGLLMSNAQVELVEENLRSLHRLSKLRKLEIDSETYKRVSLDKIAFPLNLSNITLLYFRGLKDEDMNALGQIPTLQILRFLGVDCSEKRLHCGSAGSFPQLQVFIMESVKVAHVILEDGAMPKLRRAVFDKCPGLKFENIPEQMRRLGSNLHFEERAD